MNTVLQVDNRSSIAEEIILQRTSYQTSPQLLRDRILDKAIAAFSCTHEEMARAMRLDMTHEN
ncbi:MAG: hypothetical protein AB1861_16840 [Cyanobacteriota bacterium]